MSAKNKGFGALSQLREITPKAEEARNLESEATRPVVDDNPWVSLGTEVREATKRRLKVYAGQSGGKMKELTDRAINAYLDGLER